MQLPIQHFSSRQARSATAARRSFFCCVDSRPHHAVAASTAWRSTDTTWPPSTQRTNCCSCSSRKPQPPAAKSNPARSAPPPLSFTALHADYGRLDATLADLGHHLDWAQVHKARPRPALLCPQCEWGLHAKVSRYGVRFFCHDPGRPPSCELSNESWEHHMFKLELAAAIREADWFAELAGVFRGVPGAT
ncbi:hypothetical protein AB0I75_35655 [Streptomyces sp. NPDC050273]|uniref:hypothetical protein n=1 Tax=Streptomyces sp. NPDC050273 TaxID=3154933 RepID=UPI003412F542